MMRRVFMTAMLMAGSLLPGLVRAQGTKLWSVERYEDMEKGTTEGVAIRSDGRLEPGLATSLLYASGKGYAWSLAADAAGNGYLGLGGTASGSAVVMKVTPAGQATQIFAGKELTVQALAVLPGGALLAATSPDGKVYRIPAGGGDAQVVMDTATTEEKPKYLWDLAVGRGGEIYVAAGAPAVVYRIPAGGGKAEVLFKTADQHIRCLMMAADGTLWAGSDGAGVIYRIATGTPGAKPFAAYAAPRREITALAMDAAGNVFASGVGTGHATLPPLPITGTIGVTVVFTQPGSSTAAGANALVPEGSEIYRIAVDGTPQRLVTLRDDVVYALTVRNGSLLAATGNRGRVYRVDTNQVGRFADVAHLDAAQGMAFAAVQGGLMVATSNSGKVFRLGDGEPASAVYTSEVFDAQSYSQWGRAEIRGQERGSFELFVRSGNVESPLMGWSDWSSVSADGGVVVPPGRFAQWKALLRARGAVDSVGLNYLPKNLAPVVDEVVVQPGARVPPPPQQSIANIPISFSPAPGTQTVVFTPDPNAAPLMAQKDKSAVTVRWLAHDDNGDDMVFAVWYRGAGEANWRLLKDKISERSYSFDATLLPDGSYELKVIASDSPAHTDADALVAERVSEVFVLDTTPPVPGTLNATLVHGVTKGGNEVPHDGIHATLEARDATSPIAHAEYSVDAGAWQYLEPVGKVSDSLVEHYDFTATIPPATGGVMDAKEHVLAVRVYDRYENVTTVKTVVR
jgi:hypothetical protein